MKRIWLVRHAASDDHAASDRSRPLSARGRKDAAQMARYFGAQTKDHKATWLLTSTATRAEQTSAYIAQGFEISTAQQVRDSRLYLADPETIVSVLQEIPDDINCAVLVAHNPGLTWLVNSWSERSEQLNNLSTLGSALFQSNVSSWAGLTQARRVSLMTPGQLPN